MKTCSIHGTPLNGAGNCLLCQYPEGVPGIETQKHIFSDEECARLAEVSVVAEFRNALFHQAEFLRRYLEQLVHVPVKDEQGRTVNGFAAAQIPDWAIKQQIQSIEEVLSPTNDDAALNRATEEENKRLFESLCGPMNEGMQEESEFSKALGLKQVEYPGKLELPGGGAKVSK